MSTAYNNRPYNYLSAGSQHNTYDQRSEYRAPMVPSTYNRKTTPGEYEQSYLWAIPWLSISIFRSFRYYRRNLRISSKPALNRPLCPKFLFSKTRATRLSRLYKNCASSPLTDLARQNFSYNHTKTRATNPFLWLLVAIN